MELAKIYISFCALLRKEMVRILRIWPQTIIPPVITTTLYFLIFGKLIGARIGEVNGSSFIEFIVPGLIVSSLISNAYINAAFSIYAMRFIRSIEEILVSPIPYYIFILSFICSSIARGLITAILIAAISLFFVPTIVIHNFLVLFTVGIISAFLFGALGVINGMYARSFDDASLVPTFIITPLTYLGGVFYSVDMLSGPLKTITLFNPIYYIISAFRYGFLGYDSVNVMLSLFILVALSCIAFYGALVVLKHSKQ